MAHNHVLANELAYDMERRACIHMIDLLIQVTLNEDWNAASTLLYKHWSDTCPLVYAANIDSPWESAVDESRIVNELLYPLVAMLHGEDVSPGFGQKDVTLQRLNDTAGIDSSASRVGKICGRMFRNGEPNYSCKDCATDGTCVLCYECFINSPHKNHKYKMHTSMGCGYCDCGDTEAWSNDYACRLHSTTGDAAVRQQTDVEHPLPKDIEVRLYNLTLIAIEYAVQLLCHETDEELEGIVTPKLGDDQYQAMLMNDETHTYEGVIRALELSIHCNKQQAMRLATIVDREGRSIVKSASKDICMTVKTSIERRTSKEMNRRTQKTGPLGVKVIRSSIVACQNFAVHLITWLTEKVREFEPLGEIIGRVLLYSCERCRRGRRLGVTIAGREGVDVPKSSLADVHDIDLPCGHDSNCLRLMIEDRQLWKSARSASHQMIMSTVLMNLELKQDFGRIFIRNYSPIYRDYIDDDHEHSVSVMAMAVQVFTVTTVARQLIIKEDALKIIIGCLTDFCQRYVIVSPFNKELHHLDFTPYPNPAVLRRAMQALTDFAYLVSVIPKPDEWSDERLRRNVSHGGAAFLRFLRIVDGMDEVQRQQVEHQATESEWETAFGIFMHMQESLASLLCWARTDPRVHMELVKRCLREIANKAKTMPEILAGREEVEVNGITAHSISFNVSNQQLSVHRPLWRFFAGLFAASPAILANYVASATPPVTVSRAAAHEQWLRVVRDTSFLDLVDSVPPEHLLAPFDLRGMRSILMEMPLRVLVLEAQHNAQMWRRNGFSLSNQVYNYASHLCRTEMFDRDILLLQICAALMNPESFLIRVIHRFELTRWAQIGYEDAAFTVGASSPPPSSSVFGGDADEPPPTPTAAAEELSKISVRLAEDMLHLLIMILGERYLPGVSASTPTELLQREILHFLCTGPKPFSQIERIVPQDPSVGRLSLYEVVNSVGDFHKPAAGTAGRFQLKCERLVEYNQFFYHYTKQQASQAEQHQKRIRAAEGPDLKACPPPRLPDFAPFYAPILRLFDAATFTNLLRVVFERVEKRSRFASDGLYQRALFLVGMALNEQQRVLDGGELLMPFGFWERAKESGVFTVLQRLHVNANESGGPNANLLNWVVQKYRSIGNALSNKNSQITSGEPLMPNATDAKSAKRADLAAKKRQIALDRMKRLQKAFMNKAADAESNEVGSETTDSVGQAINADFYDDDCEQGIISASAGFPVCCGPNKTKLERVRERRITCILCQESELLTYAGSTIVCSGYIQHSRLFSIGAPIVHDEPGVFARADQNLGLSISTCSHTMHYSCYIALMRNLTTRDRQRQRQRFANSESGEYLCPLCKRFSCCTLPLLPVVESLPDIVGFSTLSSATPSDFDDWLHSMKAKFELQKTCSESACQQPAAEPIAGSSKRDSIMSYMDDSPPPDGQLQQVGHSSTSSGTQSTPPSNAITDDDRDGGGATSDEEEAQGGNNPDSMRTRMVSFMRRMFATKESVSGPNRQATLNVPESFTQWEAIAAFLKDLHKIHYGPDHRDVRSFTEVVNVLKACAFLLRSIHSILEVEEKPLFGALNTRHKDCLIAMVRLASVVPLNIQPVTVRAFFNYMLKSLLVPAGGVGPAGFSSSTVHLHAVLVGSRQPLDTSSNANESISIMDVDMLTLAFQLIVCIGWTNAPTAKSASAATQCFVADGSVDELHVIRLTFIAHIYQVCVNFDKSEDRNRDVEMEVEPATSATADPVVERSRRCKRHFSTRADAMLSESDQSVIQNLYIAYAHLNRRLENVHLLYEKICEAAINFLRPLALFYNALTLIPPPEALKDPSLNELEALCRYLGFSQKLHEIVCSHEVERLFKLWSERYRPSYDLSPRVDFPLRIKLLIDLPRDYSELIKRAADFRCPSIRADNITATVPMLCLNCGEMMCSRNYCCQRQLNDTGVGACTYHMSKCAQSCGIFLGIRECQIIMLMMRKAFVIGCHKAAPYVDEFGETDPGLRRGYPMQLSRELYAKIQRIWIHQEVAEEIQNQVEINHRNMAFEWITF